MTRPGKIALTALLLAGLLSGAAERHVFLHQRAQLALQDQEVARLEAEVRQARVRFEKIMRDASAAEQEVASGRADLAAFEASPTALWPKRVNLLKQLLTELPSQRIPELRLLAPVDWIDVARTAELDTAAKIRTALAALRAIARGRFATVLQDALRRFTAQSGGELPADIGHLAVFLSAPADVEMLARYEMTRGGKMDGEGEILVKEKPVSDMILTVSLNGWSISNGPKAPAGPDESDMDVMTRGADAIGSALAATFGDEGKEMMANVAQGVQSLTAFGDNLHTTFGEEFGDNVKAAARQFAAAHPNETITNFAQLLPYMKDSEALIAKVRPVFARIEYLTDHQFKGPGSPAELQPYLEKPFDPQKAMRLVKISYDGEHVDMTFSLSFDHK